MRKKVTSLLFSIIILISSCSPRYIDQPPAPGSLFDAINVKDNKMRKWTLLHELGHIIDMSLGRLSQTPPRWMGKKMNRDLPWDIRPWEISADEWAVKMWEALVDEPIPYIILKIEN